MVAATLAALSVAGDAVASESARERCATRGRTVDMSRYVRAFSTHDRLVFYACWLRTGRTRFLGDVGTGSGSSDVPAVSVSGYFVAWQYRECVWPRDGTPPHGQCHMNTMRILNMRTRKLRARFELPGDEEVTELVLAPNGFAAWIEEWVFRDTRVLRRFDAGGFTVVASGSRTYGPRELTRRRSTIYWTQNGDRRSAQLR